MGAFRDEQKLLTIKSNHRYICKKCGRKTTKYPYQKSNKVICVWCGNYIYLNPKEEFATMLKEKMKENKMKFIVYGNPQSKGRPRFRRTGSFISTYTPKETAIYEKKVKDEYLSINGNTKIDGALKLKIKAYFMPPKSLSKKKQQELLNTPHIKKPDLDNIVKIICDGLNGVAYEDDNAISEIEAIKYYDEVERVEVEIEEL